MNDMHFFEREFDGRRYRFAAESSWDPVKKRSTARQVVLGPADPAPVADLGLVQAVGTRAIGDVGALMWVAEKLDIVGHINRACGDYGSKNGASVGEMVVAVAIQRACLPGPKKELAEFLDDSVPRLSCLPGSAFSGQVFHRIAQQVEDSELEAAQVAIAQAAIGRFNLSADVLAFDTTNFDTFIATTTAGELARRGHAKSKRGDLRVVGLGLLVSETGHVPLLYRTYSGNSSDQAVLDSCLDGLSALHTALDLGEGRTEPGQRTLVRDGGFWSPQLELHLEVTGYYNLISLPLGHTAAQQALEHAAGRWAMRQLSGRYENVRAARLRTKVGELDRTLVVVESQALLEGQKRGIAARLVKAKDELVKLSALVAAGRIRRTALEQRVQKALSREHLSSFVVTEIGGDEVAPTFRWFVDQALRRKLETTRLGRRVLSTDQHTWTTERIIHAFRGQWNVEELFRRSKKGGTVPWGPSHQWTDGSLRLHTFATVLGLMLVSLVKIALGTEAPIQEAMNTLAGIKATKVRVPAPGKGRPRVVLVLPDLSTEQRRAIDLFELDRWLPALSSSRPKRATKTGEKAVA